MKFFDGLYPYEIVLLVLGVLLFLVLILAFTLVVIRGKPYGKFFPFFVLPILMIGFPGVKTFEISESMVKIEKYTQALQQSPTDVKLRASLTKEVANLSARPLTDPQASISIARAQFALGDTTAAKENLKKTLNVAPEMPAALELKERIELDRNLAALVSQVEQNPGNAEARDQLAKTVVRVAPLKFANPEAITNVARAQQVLGDHAEAQANVDKALAIKPDLAPAIRLKRQIMTVRVPSARGNQ